MNNSPAFVGYINAEWERLFGMNECWINVYEKKGYGAGRWPALDDAVLAARASEFYWNIKCLYRLHVKMKFWQLRTMYDYKYKWEGGSWVAI